MSLCYCGFYFYTSLNIFSFTRFFQFSLGKMILIIFAVFWRKERQLWMPPWLQRQVEIFGSYQMDSLTPKNYKVLRAKYFSGEC